MFILLIFLPPLFLNTFFNFLSSVLYFLCLFLLLPSIFSGYLNTSIPSSPVVLSLLSFVLFPPSFLLSGAQVSTSCPQSAPLSSYSAVPSTIFLSSRLLLRSSQKGQKYKTISYARRGPMDCPTVPEGSPTVHVCISSK